MDSIVTFTRLGRHGRFANQLFQVASTIGVARANDKEFAFPKWINHDHKERFNSDEDCDVYKFFENQLPELDQRECVKLNIEWGYRRIVLDRGVSYDLHGHMQSDKYFDHCIDEVRHFLTLKEEPDYQPNVCAVHVRRGDYDDRYHPIIRQEYYEQAMSLFRGVQFLVFSDDIPACKVMFGNAVQYSEGRDYIEDFKLMKKCQHFIIANSSYSLMASILSEAEDKKIICPSNWFGEAWGSCYKDMAKDVYPKNSVVI